MNRLNESAREELWQEMDYVNGRRYFGDLEAQVQTTTETDHITLSDRDPTLSIIVPTMERPDRTVETINSLGLAAEKAKIATEIVIVDNGFTPHLHYRLRDEFLAHNRNRRESLTGITYHFDPRLTFPMARNIGFKLASETSDIYGSWDSDIYCGENTLKELFTEWNQRPEYIGMAPALASYNGPLEKCIKDSEERYKEIQYNAGVRALLSMPGMLGDAIGRRDGNVIRSTMMRGSYFFRKNIIPDIATHQAEDDFYLRDFIVWSNVPMCMSANEVQKSFGYVISPLCLAFHKEGGDGVSMGHDLPQRIAENLKSLCMLFYRNRVFPDSYGEVQHDLLVRFNTEALARLFKTDFDTATGITGNLELMAKQLMQ